MMYGDFNNPLYNSMINPYLQNQQSQYHQTPRMEVVKVNGENGARAFSMGPNSSALLLDESGIILWVVTTDGAGYKTVAPFDISPHQAASAPNYDELDARITRLEEILNGITSNSSTTRRKQSGKSTDDDAAT